MKAIIRLALLVVLACALSPLATIWADGSTVSCVTTNVCGAAGSSFTATAATSSVIPAMLVSPRWTT